MPDYTQIDLGRLLTQPGALSWDDLSPLAWQTLFQSALAEGIAPILYWNFVQAGRVSLMPAETRSSFRTVYRQTWCTNQNLLVELRALQAAFQQEDIPLVLLKGACYLLTIYPDAGSRPMGDLDVLVPKTQFDRALDLCRRLGYRDDLPDAFPGLHQAMGHHVYLHKEQASVELHYDLIAGGDFVYAVPVEWFWSQIEPLPSRLPGFEHVFMLSPTAQLLYASAHIALQHGVSQSPLHWFYDVHLLSQVYSSRLDWDLFLERAQIFGWSSAILAVLARVRDCFGASIPQHVWAALLQHADRHRGLVALKETAPETRTLGEYQKFRSLKWSGRLRLALALLFPAPVYMRQRYRLHSNWRLPFFYLYRWWDISTDILRTLLLSLRDLRRSRQS